MSATQLGYSLPPNIKPHAIRLACNRRADSRVSLWNTLTFNTRVRGRVLDVALYDLSTMNEVESREPLAIAVGEGLI